MDMKTTWVTFSATEDGIRARPVDRIAEAPGACCARVDGACLAAAECV